MEQYPNFIKLARALVEDCGISASFFKERLEENKHCLELLIRQIFPVTDEAVSDEEAP